MACCQKEYADVCEILVCLDAPAPHDFGLYQRLRFGLLASSWLPSPLGIFLWSALHVMLLIVCGPAFWVLGLLAAFLCSSVCSFVAVALILSFYVYLSSIALVFDLVCLLVRSIWFCLSLGGFLACHEPFVELRGVCMTIDYWEVFKPGLKDLSWCCLPFGVPCMSGSLYKQTKARKLKTWARWCEEVVHMHEAIAL